MLSANVVADHTVTIYPGEVQSSIGTTNIKAFCNDADGYSLYVKAANTTSLTSTTSDYTIPTGLNVNGTTSSWSMKLTPSGTSYIPELGNYFQNTTTTDANGYSIVPADYEEATHYTGPTDSTIGSLTQATYRVYISPSQPAGVYTGSLIYKLVHPKGAPAEVPCEGYGIMQGFSQSSLANVGDTATLCDSRDGKKYTVAKLADGNVWMTQNLALGGSEPMLLIPEDTDITSNWTLPASVAKGSWSSSRVNPEFFAAVDNGYDAINGNYYNWTAAIAMDDSSSLTKGGNNAQSSICPKGWRLPIGGDSGNEFESLLSQYGYAYDWMNVATFTGEPLSFAFSGYYDGGVGDVGDYGCWWSSTMLLDRYAYVLYGYSDGNVYLGNGGSRDLGFSVRCVAR